MAASLTSTGITFSDGTSTSTNLIPAGTLMLFQQTAAPTGWTKQTTHDDKALRVVSGAVSSGGSVGFTTAFAASLSAGATTLSAAQMPSHNHIDGNGEQVHWGRYGGTYTTNGPIGDNDNGQNGWGAYTSSSGGGGSHTHTLPSFAVQYVDLIIASKN